MKRIEAATLEEAYSLACRELECSMSELKYEIVQYPGKGVLGFFSKPAIIVADIDWEKRRDVQAQTFKKSSEDKKIDGTKDFLSKSDDETTGDSRDHAMIRHQDTTEEADNFSDSDRKYAQKTQNDKGVQGEGAEREILEGFFAQRDRTELSDSEESDGKKAEDSIDETDLASEIEKSLATLMANSCFEIDVVEVDVADGTAYIFIDGEDAALLIGKEGYRYNALSYLLYNWLHARYGLHTKLEIAHFLSSQEEMIRKNLQSVIEHVRSEGWGRTRPLDGILVQLALEHLRNSFPNKYVAIKRQRDGKRYVLVNEFNSRK